MPNVSVKDNRRMNALCIWLHDVSFCIMAPMEFSSGFICLINIH
jgi:hypothetical protein